MDRPNGVTPFIAARSWVWLTSLLMGGLTGFETADLRGGCATPRCKRCGEEAVITSLRPKEGENCEDTPMRIRRLIEPELEEDLGHMSLHGSLSDE